MSAARGDELNRESESIDFDVVTELVFSDRDSYLAWIEALGVKEVATDASAGDCAAPASLGRTLAPRPLREQAASRESPS